MTRLEMDVDRHQVISLNSHGQCCSFRFASACGWIALGMNARELLPGGLKVGYQRGASFAFRWEDSFPIDLHPHDRLTLLVWDGAGSANLDSGLSGSSFRPQPKMAWERRADEQSPGSEPHSDLQGEGGIRDELGSPNPLSQSRIHCGFPLKFTNRAFLTSGWNSGEIRGCNPAGGG